MIECSRDKCSREGTHFMTVNLAALGARLLSPKVQIELFDIPVCRDHGSEADPREFFPGDQGQAMVASALRSRGEGPHADWASTTVTLARLGTKSVMRRHQLQKDRIEAQKAAQARRTEPKP